MFSGDGSGKMNRLLLATLLCLTLTCCLGDTSESVPDFSKMKNTSERKRVFFCYLAPMIQKENDRLLGERKRLSKIMKQEEKGEEIGRSSRDFVEKLASDYGLSTSAPTKAGLSTLLGHVDEVPVSLGLAQAANESAWGTSRFAREGHNYFGQWCFEKGCGLVPAERPKGKVYEVRRFANAQESVDAFVRNLNGNRTYSLFRKIRAEERTRGKAPSGVAVAAGLRDYSARGEEYVKTLQSMIRFNHLAKFETASGIKEACPAQATHAQSDGNHDGEKGRS